MRIGFVELVLLLFIASITVGPNVALFADRWLRRAQRTSAAAARRKAQLEAQAAIEREALMTRFRVASNIFALLMLAALAYGLLLRPIDTPPKAYTAPDVRQDDYAAALKWTQRILQTQHGRHEADISLGVSPHRARYVTYAGKRYPAGFCEVNIL